jgi:hypothetical protein
MDQVAVGYQLQYQCKSNLHPALDARIADLEEDDPFASGEYLWIKKRYSL